jgi:hypothetical protein
MCTGMPLPAGSLQLTDSVPWLRRTLSTKAFGLPAVQAVITHKWDTWARRVLIWEFGLYLIWLLGFQAFIILFQVTLTPRIPFPGAQR